MTTHAPASYTATIPATTVSALETMTYEFRVVEHLDENDKVTKYVMQMQIWSHKPTQPAGSYSNPTPTLIRDWHDVPRVRMKNGVEQPMQWVSGATGTSNNYIS